MTEDRCYYVYVYFDPDTRTPIYVGKGKAKRYKIHMTYARTGSGNLRFHNKLRQYIKVGKEPIIDIVLKDLSESVALDMERFLISQYKRIEDGGTLYNITLGGEGFLGLKPWNTGKRNHLSAETRKSISENLIKYYQTHTSARKGKPSPAKWKNNRSNKKAWLNSDLFYEYYTNGVKSAKTLSRVFPEISPTVFNKILSYISESWIPLEDPEWVLFSKERDDNSRLVEIPYLGLNRVSNSEIYSRAELFYTHWCDKIGAKSCGNMYGIDYGKVASINSLFKGGWIPSEDSKYLFLKSRAKVQELE